MLVFFRHVVLILHISREKTMEATSLLIIEICSGAYPKKIKGDILVIYGPTQTKSPNSPTKARLLHVDWLIATTN